MTAQLFLHILLQNCLRWNKFTRYSIQVHFLISVVGCSVQRREQTKIFGGQNVFGEKCLILGEQQYFVWDTAFQSTK